MKMKMSHNLHPEFAVVFVAADGENLRAMMANLREQTIRDVLEVVLVVPENLSLSVDEQDRTAFHQLRVVTCDRPMWLGNALALGVSHATAPWVAMIEDHCFPEHDWAEALLHRHREGYSVVGPEIRNANPDTALSWCSFLLTHGGWSAPASAGVVETVAGDNSSYCRDAILALGAELGVLLASGTLLHLRLRNAGHRVFLEPQAKLSHVTPSRLHSFIGSRFYNGRAFAGLWSRGWTWPRRWYHAAISPLIALRRVVIAFRQATRPPANQSALRVIPLLGAAFLASSLGYVIGFLFGAGASPAYSSDLYFHRDSHLDANDHRIHMSPSLNSH
jgi:hypothetical protein